MLAGSASDVKEKYGDITDEEFYKDLFKDGPPLCGQTCAWLATGRGKELRGFYIGMLNLSLSADSSLTYHRLSARCCEAARIWT
jgi:hypothetical protein